MTKLNDIYIIEDVIPKAHADYLEQFYVGSNIDWWFQEDITYSQESDIRKTDDRNYGFSNLIQSSEDNHTSPIYHTAAPIIYAALNKLNLHPLMVLRVRSFIQLPLSNQHNKINKPHVDSNVHHIVILYYLTDSDGETIIYNETEESENYTIKERIKPKKGSCVVFDGSLYHSSSQPTSAVRATININVII